MIELKITGYVKIEGGKTICQLYCSCGQKDCEHLKLTASCKKCGKKILWAKTLKGKNMPVDSETKEPHWATCKFADEFRKEKK